MNVATQQRISDKEVLRLNSVGISLVTIGRILNCHPTSITLRLKSLGVPPSDTRRSFMEDVFFGLTPAQQMWLMDQLGAHIPIKDFIKGLIVDAYIDHTMQKANPDAA